MRLHASATFALVLLAVSATTVDAQVIQRPPRSTGGLFGGRQPADPNRTRQELTLTFDFLGGYDDHLSPEGESAPTDPLAPRRSGTTATVSGVLNYQRARATRGIEASVRSAVATYRDVDVRPLVGGRGNLRAFGRLFDRMNVGVWGEADYRPTFMFGTFPSAADGSDVATPPPDPTAGVTEIRSVNTAAGSTLALEWGTRQRTNAGQSYSRNRSFGPEDMNVEDHSAVLGHSWDFTRNAALQGSYSFSHQRAGSTTVSARPLETHTATLGFEVRVPISRTRRLSFSGNAGATQVNTVSSVGDLPVQYRTPSAGGSARMDLGRTWAFSADVNRNVTMLEGLTLQTFLTTSIAVWTGGSLGRRSMLAVSGNYSDGSPHEGDIGSFRSTGGTAQLQYRVSRCCSVVTSYSYYQHQIRDIAAVPRGFPLSIERNAVRVGMTFWLPLYGTFSRDGAR